MASEWLRVKTQGQSGNIRVAVRLLLPSPCSLCLREINPCPPPACSLTRSCPLSHPSGQPSVARSRLRPDARLCLNHYRTQASSAFQSGRFWVGKPHKVHGESGEFEFPLAASRRNRLACRHARTHAARTNKPA